MKITTLCRTTWVALGLGLASLPAAAKTMVLDFEGMVDGTILRQQYAYLGADMLGAYVHRSVSPLTPPHSGANVAFSKLGFMSFSFDPALTGPVISVAAYVSGNPATTMEAFNAAGVLVASATMAPATGPNARVAVSSATDPIVRVDIYGPRSSFIIDDLTITTAVTASLLQAAIQAMPATAFREEPAEGLAELLSRVAELERATATALPQTTIRRGIDRLHEAIRELVRRGPERAAALAAVAEFAAPYGGVRATDDDEDDEHEEPRHRRHRHRDAD